MLAHWLAGEKESVLAGLQSAAYLLRLHKMKQDRALVSSFVYTGTNPVVAVTPSWPHPAPVTCHRPPIPNIATPALRASTEDFEGTSSVQTLCKTYSFPQPWDGYDQDPSESQPRRSTSLLRLQLGPLLFPFLEHLDGNTLHSFRSIFSQTDCTEL